jgi:hypothetical protein
MQCHCFVNQTMAPASGKRLRLRDDMRTVPDGSKHLLTRLHSVLQQQRISSSVALDGLHSGGADSV